MLETKLNRDYGVWAQGMNPWTSSLPTPTFEDPEATAECLENTQAFACQGSWVFQPGAVKYVDLRQFLWAGLGVLREEARARGLSKKELDWLLNQAFDQFHDAGESIWTALQNVVSSPGWCAVMYFPEASAVQFQLGDPLYSNVAITNTAPCFTTGFASGAESETDAEPSAATDSSTTCESPEFAKLRRARLFYEELAQRNRDRQDEEIRDLVDD